MFYWMEYPSHPGISCQSIVMWFKVLVKVIVEDAWRFMSTLTASNWNIKTFLILMLLFPHTYSSIWQWDWLLLCSWLVPHVEYCCMLQLGLHRQLVKFLGTFGLSSLLWICRCFNRMHICCCGDHGKKIARSCSA